MKNKFTRKILSFLLFFSIISQFWLPLYANDQLTQKAITYHSWAAQPYLKENALSLSLSNGMTICWLLLTRQP